MTGIVDYGCGNLYSLSRSLEYIGIACRVSRDENELLACERIILPGVGAFGDAKKALDDSGLAKTVLTAAKSGMPILGICLGMQLLFEKSLEFGEHEGLGLIGGSVVPIKPLVGDLKVPHIGWNSLSIPDGKSKIYKYTPNGAYVYFVHSYHAECDESSITAKTEYGAMLTASVESKNVYGTQFHPEKSGEIGLDILRAFCEI